MATLKRYDFYIGIDPGAQTGFACWHKEKKELFDLKTLKIHQAMHLVRRCLGGPGDAFRASWFIRVEDPRKATYFRGNDKHKAQGAGSVKRDASIWEDFLRSLDVPFEMVRPNPKSTKLPPKIFARITGYIGKTSVHSRDAAMLVFGK